MELLHLEAGHLGSVGHMQMGEDVDQLLVV